MVNNKYTSTADTVNIINVPNLRINWNIGPQSRKNVPFLQFGDFFDAPNIHERRNSDWMEHSFTHNLHRKEAEIHTANV